MPVFLVGTVVITSIRLHDPDPFWKLAMMLSVLWPLVVAFLVVRWTLPAVLTVVGRVRRRRRPATGDG